MKEYLLKNDDDLPEKTLNLIDAFCESLRIERNASTHTIRAYHSDLLSYLRWAQGFKLDLLFITHKELRNYLANLDQASYSRTTINRRLSSLRSFYRWLKITDQVQTDPVSALQGPRQPKKLPQVIGGIAMVKLLSVYSQKDEKGKYQKQTPLDLRNQALLEFLYACGARVSEAVGLTLSNVDFKQQLVRVFGKGSKERLLPLHDLACCSMEAYLVQGRPCLVGSKSNASFFISVHGKALTTDAVRKIFKEALRRAGLDETLSPHDMRHTFATDLLEGGADLRSVQEMLGHASLSTTQIYTHLSMKHLKEVHKQALPRAEGSAD